MAKMGYGKRLAGDEDPALEADFAHLCQRDAEIAVFIDHLPGGSAMGHKVIAAEHPRYGQQAVRTSLGRLALAGHLRWIKEHITIADGSMRWVTRTYWCRVPKSKAWWAEYARERHGVDVTSDHMPGLIHLPTPEPEWESEPEAEPEPEPEPEAEPGHESEPEPSPAYLALAQLRRADRRMALTEADCRNLEPLAAEWLARGSTLPDLVRALTAQLPDRIHHPGALARKRLEARMPPKPTANDDDVVEFVNVDSMPPQRGRVTKVVMLCGMCQEPETTTKLTDGLCDDCHQELNDDVAVVEDVAYLGVTSGRMLREKYERRTGGPVPDTFRAYPVEDHLHYHFRDARERIASGLKPRKRV
ncbi:hypothetical protein U9R90_15645 [Streptomyces sp. E11-3]|uniref:hypothetical protein n=1 Tax=Streptomyces sp. E11-3 TaxID=3110112 RepID=UPI00397FD0DD